MVIPLFNVNMSKSVDEPLLKTLHSGYITEGPLVKEFEEALTSLLGARTLAVNSGTSALTLALRLAGVAPGYAVISTPMTCTATNLPILSLGGRIIWADVHPKTGLIDPESVRMKLEELPEGVVKAVMAVDWGGMPCHLSELRLLAHEYGAFLIEDAAHALGATYGEHPVGSWADMTCFSFQAIKHLTTGDGGAISFNFIEEQYKLGKLLRWFGIDREAVTTGDSRIDIDIPEWGYKFHMNDIAATIGLHNLPELENIIFRHRLYAFNYIYHLDESFFAIMQTPDYLYKSAWWLFTILLPNRELRDRFRPYMLEKGIQVSRVHRRNDDYKVFKRFSSNTLLGLKEFSDRMICIPMHAGLKQEDVETIIQACNNFAVKERGH
jgi:dTDP-4-amino-4,6-dideoxygalactose transaminase